MHEHQGYLDDVEGPGVTLCPDRLERVSQELQVNLLTLRSEQRAGLGKLPPVGSIQSHVYKLALIQSDLTEQAMAHTSIVICTPGEKVT